MKDYLFCHVKNCDYHIGVEVDASVEECEKAICSFKEHLKTHSLNDLVDYLFALMMFLEEDHIEGFKEQKK